jgi:hypothetical protein
MAEKGVLSARGERVDFDLMKIKQQIAAAPKAVTVKAREDFIDQKSKRRLNRQIREVVATVAEEVISKTPDELTIPDIITPEDEE